MPGVRRYHGRLAVGAGIAVVLAGAWALLAGHGAAFLAAVRGVSWWTLVVAVGLHVVAVVARSEAWHVSVRAAGSRLGRRCCYQVASLGFAANVVAPSFGTALRIWTLRRLKPEQAPAATALVAAEVPVLVMQVVVCAAMSFALVGRLQAPWWIPALAVLAAAAALGGLRRTARRRREGFWSGLGALRTRGELCRVAGCVALLVASDMARTVLLLHAAGLPADVFDAMALRIASGVLAALPLGVGSGAGAAMLVFGAGGVGRAAAAGVLLTATGLAADLGFGAWGVSDLASRARWVGTHRRRSAADLAAAACCVSLAVVFVAATAR
jgi:uncharacterized membrane protein YbhN (UPF0104 family)